MIDKNQAVLDFLIQCPQLKDNPLFFNFVNAKNNNKQIITVANDVAVNKEYIDGSVLKRYTFTIIDFKSIARNAVVKQPGYVDENVEDLDDVQKILDWISNQNDLRNYPDFGDSCIIESMQVLSDMPRFNGIDNATSPSLAQYSISIRIEYLDNSKQLWNN